jgi:hypothetical protein
MKYFHFLRAFPASHVFHFETGIFKMERAGPAMLLGTLKRRLLGKWRARRLQKAWLSADA